MGDVAGVLDGEPLVRYEPTVIASKLGRREIAVLAAAGGFATVENGFPQGSTTGERIEVLVGNLCRIKAGPDGGQHGVVNLIKQQFSGLDVAVECLRCGQGVVNVVLEHQANDGRRFGTDQPVLGEEMLHILSLHLTRIPDHVVAEAQVGDRVHISW